MGTHARTATTRRAILDAALTEFAAHGFDGASTRAIATRAGVHQPQINYHFDGKEALWRAAVDHLFGALTAELLPAIRAADGSDQDAAVLATIARGLAHFAARRPELNRIMVQEATSDSERLDWIVERHVRPAFDLLGAVWDRLRRAGRVPDVEPLVAYYTIVGAASLLGANAPEARRLLGEDPLTPERIERHADFVVGLVLPARPAPVGRGDEPAERPPPHHQPTHQQPTHHQPNHHQPNHQQPTETTT